MKKQKILLVDDSPKLLKLGKAIFETGGYEVVTATDGVEGLDLLLSHTIDLVMTDILMPNMDGYSFCYNIRNNEKNTAIPIIVYSATYTSQSDEELAIEVGADMFIRKPASMDFLLKAAKNLITRPKKHGHKIMPHYELADITRQYSSKLIGKLELQNEELEKTQRELIKSEKRFRALIENNFDAITLKGKEGNILYQSPATERINGYTAEETLGENATGFFHPEDIPNVLERLQTALKNPGKPIYGRSRMRHKKGHYIWIEGTTTNLLEDENVGAIVVNFRDITERKQSEEKIVKANRLYAFISGINQTIVHAKNEKDVFREACRIAIEVGKFKMAWIGIFDPEHEKLSLTEGQGILVEDAALFNDVAILANGPEARALHAGQCYVCNNIEKGPEAVSWKPFTAKYGIHSSMLLPIKKSGATFGTINLYSCELNFFDEQEILLLQEVAGDISFALDVFEKEKHRRQMEDKIIHSELLLKGAQAIAHFGSWELNFSTNIADWSEEACRIYGLSPEDNRQSYESWLSFTHPDDREYVMTQTAESEKTLSSAGFNHRIIRKDGAIRHIFSQAQFELNKDGKPIGLRGVEHDITETKEAEAERTKMIADIVQRNKNLEQFSYIISHNLRAPVANILGIVDMMQTMGIDKEEEAEITGYLGSSAQNLDNVIRDLNYILEIKHEMSEEKERVKFEALVHEIEFSISNVIKEERVQIISDFSGADDISTIKSYLYSIFLNLITNSIKYRQQGMAPVIEITSAKAGNKILLLFKDNGLGIDIVKKGAQIFGLYKRFHNHVDGKGMGLYMVKTQVEAMRGTITIASEVNKGTEFRIEFEVS